MGELHLDILVDRLKREFKVEANIGKPQVAYREALKKKTDVEAKYIRQSGGRGQYGHVIMELEPIDDGYEFVDLIKSGRIPKEYIPSVNAGVEAAMETGVLAGYPLVNIRATLKDGTYHVTLDRSDIYDKDLNVVKSIVKWSSDGVGRALDFVRKSTKAKLFIQKY